MKREFFKSKIHLASITVSDLHYEGSLSIDEALMEAADILPNEKVQVVNVNNGSRFETYAIKAERNSGEIGLNGAAARLGLPGDKIIIITYSWLEEDEAENHRPVVLHVDAQNKIVGKKQELFSD